MFRDTRAHNFFMGMLPQGVFDTLRSLVGFTGGGGGRGDLIFDRGCY